MCKDCYVYGPNGEVIVVLNDQLINQQGVDSARLEALKTSHQLGWLIKEAANNIIIENNEIYAVKMSEPTNDEELSRQKAVKLKLRMLAGVFDALETEQQALWGFPIDPNYHRFFDFPGCSCPKSLNEERMGTDFAVIDDNCPIHGGIHA